MAKSTVNLPPPSPPPSVTLELTWDEFLMLHRFIGQSSRTEVEVKDRDYRKHNIGAAPVKSALLSDVYSALSVAYAQRPR